MKRLLMVLGIAGLVGTPPAWGWWTNGHYVLTKAAVTALPEGMPAFFRSGAGMVAHLSMDPDVSKNRGTPSLRGAEYPEHFLDREYLDGHDLPGSRYEFIKLCYDAGVRPEKVGLVPYALAEWTERLTVAFAEHRKWPENLAIQQKCLVYAGFLSHYAQDMCQPLHLTIHYNGRIGGDESVAQKGIHSKIDGLIENLKMEPAALAKGQTVTPLEDLMPGILAEFEAGFALVDHVYELGPQIPAGPDENWKPVPEVAAFAADRSREAVRFTASLYLTAWRLSKGIELPGFLNRPPTGQQ